MHHFEDWEGTSKDVERKEKTVEERTKNEAIIKLRKLMLVVLICTIVMIVITVTAGAPIEIKVFLLFMCIAFVVIMRIMLKEWYDSEYEQIKAREYVKDNLSQSYVKVEPKANSKFILDLKTRAKFYAQYNEEEEIVLISVKYNGEEKYIPFEKIWTFGFTKKYQIPEN